MHDWLFFIDMKFSVMWLGIIRWVGLHACSIKFVSLHACCSILTGIKKKDSTGYDVSPAVSGCYSL